MNSEKRGEMGVIAGKGTMKTVILWHKQCLTWNVNSHDYLKSYYSTGYSIENHRKNLWKRSNDKWRNMLAKNIETMHSSVTWIGLVTSGAPNDSFLYNICLEKQKLPRIFYSLRKAKNSYMTVPLMYSFQSLSNKFPTILWS